MSTTAALIRDLAAQHGIDAEPTDYDRFADTLSSLAGDDGTLDEIERLLVHLSQRGFISRPEHLRLHVAYLRERRAAGSPEGAER